MWRSREGRRRTRRIRRQRFVPQRQWSQRQLREKPTPTHAGVLDQLDVGADKRGGEERHVGGYKGRVAQRRGRAGKDVKCEARSGMRFWEDK